MSSKSTLSYTERAKQQAHPVARRLFEIAETKKSNVVVSADITTTKELLKLADGMWVACSFPKHDQLRHKQVTTGVTVCYC